MSNFIIKKRQRVSTRNYRLQHSVHDFKDVNTIEAFGLTEKEAHDKLDEIAKDITTYHVYYSDTDAIMPLLKSPLFFGCKTSISHWMKMFPDKVKQITKECVFWVGPGLYAPGEPDYCVYKFGADSFSYDNSKYWIEKL